MDKEMLLYPKVVPVDIEDRYIHSKRGATLVWDQAKVEVTMPNNYEGSLFEGYSTESQIVADLPKKVDIHTAMTLLFDKYIDLPVNDKLVVRVNVRIP